MMSDDFIVDGAVSLPVTVAIPTYRREQVLIDTIEYLLHLVPCAAEILVLDQTTTHTQETEGPLRKWSDDGQIRWIRLSEPSIPGAMNRGLVESQQEIVLFVDDDIVPFPDLIAAHAKAHREGFELVAGRVLQPWDEEVLDASWASKRLASTESREIEFFIGCNFSLRRTYAIDIGGFDENFVRVAYDFEREFADRWRAVGRTVHFCPRAAIRHLKAPAGGTRTFGEHLTTALPAHSVGAYYYLLRSRTAKRRIREIFLRPLRAVATRHHLRRPWWIPLTLVAELSGMMWALILRLRGPRYCSVRSRRNG